MVQRLEMLKFYYHPVSGNSRRVWVALLEKNIPFEPILVNLDGEQFGDEFTTVNPLQRIPVIVDDGWRVIESLAILDYLEAKYPQPSLMPIEPQAIAKVRMVEMIAINEIQPAATYLSRQLVGLDSIPEKQTDFQQQIAKALRFYEELLGDQPYFAGEQFTLAEIVGGTLPLSHLGVSVDSFPRLQKWLQRLEERKSWQETALKPDLIQGALPMVRKILERRS